MANILDSVRLSGVTYTLAASGGTGGSGVTSGQVETMIRNYTYDKLTIDRKIDNAFDPNQYYTRADIDTKESDLNERIDELSGKTITVSGKVSTLEENVENAFQEIKNVKLELSGAIDTKQDLLVAGDNIIITGNVISAVMSGGSGVTSGQVQMMIDQSISGISGNTNVISGDVKTLSGDVKTISGNVVTISGDVQGLETKLDTLSGNVYTKSETSGKTELDTEFGKYYKKTETSSKTEIDDALNQKQDILIAGNGISIVNNVISASGGGITSGEVMDIVSGYTYDKDTIDDKIASGGGESLLDAYEFFKIKNTYETFFPSKTGATDWDDAIVDGIYIEPPLAEDPSYIYGLVIQVIDINGNRVSGSSHVAKHYVTSRINPLPDYIDIVYPVANIAYPNRFLSLVLKPKEGYRMSKIEFYWEHDEWGDVGSETIYEIEFYDEIPSGTTKDIIENYIEKIAVNAQHKFEVDGTFLKWQSFYPYENAEDAFGKGTYYPDTLVINVNQWDARSGDTRLITSGVVYKELQKYQKSLTAGDGIDITNNVISVTGGGESSGVTYTAGTGIDITDRVISSTLNAYNGTGVESLIIGSSANTVSGDLSVGVGKYNEVLGGRSFAQGLSGKTTNTAEVTFGQLNDTKNEYIGFGHSGNTVFTIGNGAGVDGSTTNYARHNAFEVRSNGDIYIPEPSKVTPNHYYQAPMIKLQDRLSEIDNKPNIWCGSESEWSQISGSTQSGTLYLIY